MLKAFMANPDLSSIDIEEKYYSYAAQERTDRYVTVRTLSWGLLLFIMMWDYGSIYCLHVQTSYCTL